MADMVTIESQNAPREGEAPAEPRAEFDVALNTCKFKAATVKTTKSIARRVVEGAETTVSRLCIATSVIREI